MNVFEVGASAGRAETQARRPRVPISEPLPRGGCSGALPGPLLPDGSGSRRKLGQHRAARQQPRALLCPLALPGLSPQAWSPPCCRSTARSGVWGHLCSPRSDGCCQALSTWNRAFQTLLREFPMLRIHSSHQRVLLALAGLMFRKVDN